MKTLSERDIRIIAKRIGHPRGPGHVKTHPNMETLRALHEAGFSHQQIAKYFSVSRATIDRRLKAERPSGIICQLKSTPPPSD